MTSFSGIPADLLDAVAYELDAIEYLRTTLHGHVEAPVGRTILVLGDLTPEGEQRRIVEAHAYCDVSGTAVHAALDRLRPLAFSATFKLQDMIAEWILRANGVFKWRFSEKLTGYDRLREASNLVEPEFFAARAGLSRAFWELYRFLEPFRGGVLHSGGVTLEPDCTVTMYARDGSALRFTPTQQGSYMRAMCLISKVMGGQVHAGSFLENLIEADFVELQQYHQQVGLTVRNARIAALVVHVPATHVATTTPLTVEIDFAQLRRTMEESYPVGPSGQLFFSASVVVNDDSREAIWELPIEAVPQGIATLKEGDGHYDKFLRIARRGTHD